MPTIEVSIPQDHATFAVPDTTSSGRWLDVTADGVDLPHIRLTATLEYLHSIRGRGDDPWPIVLAVAGDYLRQRFLQPGSVDELRSAPYWDLSATTAWPAHHDRPLPSIEAGTVVLLLEVTDR